MFPVRGIRGNNYPNEASGYGGNVRFHQRRPLLLDTMGGFGGNQMQRPPYGMNLQQRPMLRPNMNVRMPLIGARMPNQGQQNRGYDATKGQKRRNDDNPSYPEKRAKPNSHVPSTSSFESQSQLSEEVDDFIVPVSHGTEKITMDIWNYFLSARMKDDDLKRKFQLRKCLLTIFNGAFPNCRLFVVGSSMTGFATTTSDVDMCLMISENEIDQKRDATLILNSLSKALRQCSSVQNLRVIKAKVPILKFYDNIMGVECDLNINNLVGVRNTHLLRFYAYMDWRVRPLMLFIKRWARFHDINDASKQTVSSYTFSLMLIHYLQIGINPPVLPCLQKMKPNLFDIKTDVRKLSLKFDNDNDIDFTSKNRATLGELFLGFLNYYANVFSFSNQVISVRLGKTIPFQEASVGSHQLQWKHLNVEEPFEKSNTARSVYDKFVFMRVKRVFASSFRTLESSRDVSQILSRPF